MLIQLDTYLFRWLFGLAEKHREMAAAAVWITNTSSRIFHVTYAVFILWQLLGGDRRIVPSILGPASAYIAARALRLISNKDRPYVALEIESRISHDEDSSFPSMHSTSAFVIATSIWYVNPAVGIAAVFLAAITGLSRVMVGVHYPVDIAVGMALGVSMSIAAFTYAPLL